MEEDLLARDTGFTFPQPTVVTCAKFRTSRNLSINTTGATGSSNQNLIPTTTETRSSPSSSRQFRLPPFHAHVCVPTNEGGERVARERRESDQLDCSRDSDQLDRSLSRLLPQTLRPMLKALTHPHPLLASLTRAGVSCLLQVRITRRPHPLSAYGL